MSPNDSNILTPLGFKQYEVRQNIDVGNGVLSYQPTLNPSRYIQFGLKMLSRQCLDAGAIFEALWRLESREAKSSI